MLVAEQSAGYLTLLRAEGEGQAQWITRHVEDLHRPYGLAWRNDHVLVADQDAIWRVPHTLGAVRAGRPPAQRVEQVPPEDRKPSPGAYGAALLTQKGVFGVPIGHQNRALAVDPKTRALFVGVVGNLGVEPEQGHDSTLRCRRRAPEDLRVGVRNPAGLAFHPQTGDLWAVVQERDGLGDNLPSDYLIRVQEGGFYGWPYAYIGPHPQPGFATLAPDKVQSGDPRRPPVRGAFLGARPRVLRCRAFPVEMKAAPCWPSRVVEPLE